MLPKVKLFIVFFSFILLLSFIYPANTSANEWCQTNCATWSGGTTDCPASIDYLGQCNQTDPANFCNTSDWTFHYNPTCSTITFLCTHQEWLDNGCQGHADCSWSQIQCNVADRCPNGTTGGTGYDATGKVSAGICDATKFNGNPDSACVTGGVYKQCCSSGGYYPTTYCSNGVCPAGQITSAGVTSCLSATPSPTSTPTPTPTPPPACKCTYGQTCTTGSGEAGTQTCNGIYSGSTCVYDSSGGCSPACSACTANPVSF